MGMGRVLASGAVVGLLCVSAGPRAGHGLSIEQRIQAQRAIERVYYSHQTGAARGFEQAVSHQLLEKKVRAYLKQSLALEQLWKTPVTAAGLRAELERIAGNTQLPDRLSELYAALGNDSFLIQECLARPILVDRLSRSFFASDERIHGRRGGQSVGARKQIPWEQWWSEAQGSFDESTVPAVAAVGVELPKPVRRAAYAGGWEARQGSRQAPRPTAQAPEGCAEQDGWDEGLRYDVPGPRWFHSAVWTGTEMIVWGGIQGQEALDTDTGARYNPITDSWSPISVLEAPRASARESSQVIWTGEEMIVFTRGVGRRYDPRDDTWSPVSPLDAPSVAFGQTAVWTGTEMIIWGGSVLSCAAGPCRYEPTSMGGRYDPGTDTWTPTSTAGAPSPRGGHLAVWTGTEMIVWGPGQSGGRYDPASDTWASITPPDTPVVLDPRLAIWTDGGMFLWGVGSAGSAGALYDPGHDEWSPVSGNGAPASDPTQTAVWTGQEVILWQAGAGSGRYHPASDSWRPVAGLNAPMSSGHTAIWTGTHMVIWGAYDVSRGGRYDPVADAWTPTSPGHEIPRFLHGGGQSAVWTGATMIVWGGYDDSDFWNAGGRYDPVTDSWSPTTRVNAPVARSSHLGIWTGDVMIIWGGEGKNDADDAGRYDPISDSWLPISIPEGISPTSPAAWAGDVLFVQGAFSGRHSTYDPRTDTWSPVSEHGAPATLIWDAAVWTGEEIIFWKSPASLLPDGTAGSRYAPETDSWGTVSITGAPSLGFGSTAVWTGQKMIVYGWRDEAGQAVSDGGRYDPATDLWAPLPQAPDLPARVGQSAVWTGTEMLIWGGKSVRFDPAELGGFRHFNTGSRFDPASDSWRAITTDAAPAPLGGQSAVWADNAMLVWGHFRIGFGGRYYPTLRRDDDGDGFTACEGDCDDANPALNPAGADLPGNAIDENCDGVVVCDPGSVRNRGQLLSCVVRECRGLIASGLLSREACMDLVAP